MALDRTERQKLGVRKWVQPGCRGTLMWCTGTCKTRAALMALKGFLSKNPGKVVTIVVPTDNLKIQWIAELNKYRLGGTANVEVVNSAIKLDDPVDLLILDECHRFGSKSFITIFDKRRPKMVLGLSATFSRLDGRHILLEKYCPICDTILIDEAIENKWLSSYKEYKVLLEVDDIQEYREANASFVQHFAFFENDFNVAMNCVSNIIYRRTYGKKIGIDAKTMDAITFEWRRAMSFRKEFVMNHPKKVEIAQKIINNRLDKKIITFSATIKQAEKIGIGYTVHSGKTKRKNRMTIAEFSNLRTGVINASKALDEGTDIPGLNTAIVLCNSSSQTQKTQRVG